MGSHVFFVRRDLLHPSDWNLPIRAVQKQSHKIDHGRRPFFDTLLGHYGKVKREKTGHPSDHPEAMERDFTGEEKLNLDGKSNLDHKLGEDEEKRKEGRSEL
jgi:hypothetical protein